MTFHNSALASLVHDGNYRVADLARIGAALNDHQSLTFVRLPSGLYSASSAGESITIWRADPAADRDRQIVHFNRSLAQITGDWRCAELY